MKWVDFLEKMGNFPVISTENMRLISPKKGVAEVQVSRWRDTGKLLQLKRGLYLVAPPYRKGAIFEPLIAQSLKKPSYISLEKAMEFHGLIPEGVPVTTSLTTKRQARFDTAAGVYVYRHIQKGLFWGYNALTFHRQTGFMAKPEKALLDFLYLNGVPLTEDYLAGLRLQNMDNVDPDRLREFALRFDKPKMMLAVEMILQLMRQTKEGEKEL